MANFSKEYIEKYFPEWCYDFSVDEMFNEIEEGHYRSKICEGFGYIKKCIIFVSNIKRN